MVVCVGCAADILLMVLESFDVVGVTVAVGTLFVSAAGTGAAGLPYDGCEVTTDPPAPPPTPPPAERIRSAAREGECGCECECDTRSRSRVENMAVPVPVPTVSSPVKEGGSDSSEMRSPSGTSCSPFGTGVGVSLKRSGMAAGGPSMRSAAGGMFDEFEPVVYESDLTVPGFERDVGEEASGGGKGVDLDTIVAHDEDEKEAEVVGGVGCGRLEVEEAVSEPKLWSAEAR